MHTSNARITDALSVALDMTRGLGSKVGLVGYGVVHLIDGRGRTKLLLPFANLVTDAGDLYYAQKAIVAISPAAPSAPTAITGMKLGTGNTAAAKSGAGGALVTYLSGSNASFDSGYPSYTNLGAGSGVTADYKTTWAAGTATSTSINEVVIVNDSGTDATSSAANTISRSVFASTINKGASDTLAVTWSHKFLGS